MTPLRTTALALLLGCAVLPSGLAAPAAAQVVISVGVPPPPLPVYVQPPIPEVGYIWTPGYWAYDDLFGYYWVPGTWVEPPRVDLLWTPGYWAFSDGVYGYRPGYWADHVGFYGGIDYGFGYTGSGYEGGYWRGGNFFYNTAVTAIATGFVVANVYNRTVINNVHVDRVSFNGGQGGIALQPTPQQIAFSRQQHVAATPVQQQHVQLAQRDPTLREAENKGRPPIAATARPTSFSGPGVVAAKTGATRPAGQPVPQGHNAVQTPPGVAQGGVAHAVAPPGGTATSGSTGHPLADHAVPGHALPGQAGARPLPGQPAGTARENGAARQAPNSRTPAASRPVGAAISPAHPAGAAAPGAGHVGGAAERAGTPRPAEHGAPRQDRPAPHQDRPAQHPPSAASRPETHPQPPREAGRPGAEQRQAPRSLEQAPRAPMQAARPPMQAPRPAMQAPRPPMQAPHPQAGAQRPEQGRPDHPPHP